MKIKITILVFFLIAFQVNAEVSLPQFFSDNMILQRDQKVPVWGWAEQGEKVTIAFNGQTIKTKADKNGKWYIELDAMKASSQPLEMKIKGQNEIIIKNILIGDVWICSGQSNMEWPIASSNNFAEEVKNAKYPNIRLLQVPNKIAFKPAEDILTTKWVRAEGNNINNFSAVGYFFGRHIHENHKVPIGLISTNWGGTRAETWTSAEKLKPFEYTTEPIKKMKARKLSLKESIEQEEKAIVNWIDANYPKNDRGDQQKWFSNEYNFSDWKNIPIPSAIEDQPGMEDFDGVVWLKKEFSLSPEHVGKDLFLRLGVIQQLETIYINGIKVVENNNPKIWRSHPIPQDVFKAEGTNVITIKLFNYSGKGGLVEVAKDRMAFSPARWNDTKYDIPLAGLWKYKVSTKLVSPITSTIPELTKYRPDNFPSSLYNGMIHPLIPMAVKGAIWYQGESNANNFEESIRYQYVFSNMIKDWRERWGYDFDFYYVQLANYSRRKPSCDMPCEQSWAYVRESQTNILELQNTGMAVIIDVGDANDIHPRDKQTVGKRLGLIADAQTYGKEVVYSGPLFKSLIKSRNEIWLNFEHIGSGLISKDKYGYLRGFQIAGEDQVFHWAKARIQGRQVVVSSEQVDKPIAVRYAWANNPEDANLYNKEGLPASPFRTDKWELYKK
ncbi:MAG: sialate O-acetylesterase [Bacteroidota bacterium]